MSNEPISKTDDEGMMYIGGSDYMGPCDECGAIMECVNTERGFVKPEDLKPQIYRCENGHERTLHWKRYQE